MAGRAIARLCLDSSHAPAISTLCLLSRNYVYDEALGDPDGNIPPGTRFEDVPDDWFCPACGVDKSVFDRQEA